ncbi:MAG: hypothetical protein NUV37_03195 [Nanoarchaeota archaeon]|nr:hypothetical protein [Nanoarchaeota archaeon]
MDKKTRSQFMQDFRDDLEKDLIAKTLNYNVLTSLVMGQDKTENTLALQTQSKKEKDIVELQIRRLDDMMKEEESRE